MLEKHQYKTEFGVGCFEHAIFSWLFGFVSLGRSTMVPRSFYKKSATDVLLALSYRSRQFHYCHYPSPPPFKHWTTT
jgi:hypothetical protein